MAEIIIPRKQLRQPRGRLTLNSENELARGLTGLWAFNRQGARNLVTGEVATVSGAIYTPGPNGVSIKTTSDADYATLASSALSVLPASNVVTIAVWVRKTDATYRPSRIINDGSNNRCNMQIYSDGVLYRNFGVSSQRPIGGPWADDRLMMVVDGTNNTLYQNGALKDSAAVGVGTYSNAGNTGLYLGDYDTADTADRAEFYTAAIWNRALTAPEAQAWAYAPWQLFEANSPRVYSFPAGGSTSQNLAASGAATATGTATAAAQVALAGVGVSLASGSASIAASKPLAASGVGTASGTAAPKIDIALSALGLTVASGTAALSSNASGSLAATGSATAGGSAAAVANVTISASGLAQAAAQAGLAASVLLAGAGAAAAAGNADLALQLQAAAAGAAQAGGSATITGAAAGQLSGYGHALASGAALLTLDVRLAATGSSSASGAAALSADNAAALAASGGASASGSGAVTAQVTVTAAGFVKAMGAGVLHVQIPLQATGAAQASGSAYAVDGEALVLIYNPAYEVIAYGRRYEVSRR